MRVQGHKISEAEAHEKYGWLNLNKLVQVSSNVGAAKVALKLGADHYFNTIKAFGFGGKTGTGFPGEISGQLPPRKVWQPITLANIGFGQGILVTPMQMTRAYAAFLNGGWLVQPKLIKESVEAQHPSHPAPVGGFGFFTSANAAPENESIQLAVRPEPPRRVLSQQVADLMLENLEGPLKEGGTGIKANLSGYEIAGKTGTAQKVDPLTHSYSRSKYVASFIGMPLNVEPKVVIFTAIDEPHGVYYAGDTAAPLFREVLNAVANRFSLPTKSGTPNRVLADAASGKSDIIRISQASHQRLALMGHPAAAATAAEPDNILQWQGATAGGRTIWTMPSLKGLTPREALRALQGHRFQMEMRGSGVIRSQYPSEGSALTEGETVKLGLGEL
jgi:cell division protein FtsI (penicillin-binding protein 3)